MHWNQCITAYGRATLEPDFWRNIHLAVKILFYSMTRRQALVIVPSLVEIPINEVNTLACKLAASTWSNRSWMKIFLSEGASGISWLYMPWELSGQRKRYNVSSEVKYSAARVQRRLHINGHCPLGRGWILHYLYSPQTSALQVWRLGPSAQDEIMVMAIPIFD